MAELTQQEAVKVVAESYNVNVPAIRPAANTIAEASGKQFRAGNADTALRMVSGDMVPHTEEDVNRTLLHNLSSERDVATGTKKLPNTGTEERRRLDDAKTVVEATRVFIEKGTIDPTLQTKIETYLSHNSPVFREIFSAANTAEKKALVKRIVEDPGFRDTLRRNFTEALDPKKRLTQEDVVRRIEEELATMESKLEGQVSPRALTAAKNKLAQAETNWAANRSRILELETKEKTFAEQTALIPQVNQERMKLQIQLNPTLIELQSKRTELASLQSSNPQDPRVAQLQGEISATEARNDYRRYQSLVQFADSTTVLSQEINTLQGQILPVKQELDRATQELNSLNEKAGGAVSPQEKKLIEAQIQQKRVEIADAKALLEGEMIQFYRDVTHMPEDAVESYMNETFGRLRTLYQEEGKAAKDKETTLAESAANKASNVLWKTTRHSGRRDMDFRKIDRTMIKTHVQTFLELGSEGLANMVQTEITLRTAIALTAGGLTVEERDAFVQKMTTDPEYKAKVGKQLGAEALSDYFVAGGRLNRDMMLSIVGSPGGQELLAAAQERRTTIEKSLSETERGILGNLDKLKGNRTNAEFLKANWWKFGLGLILLLLILLGGKAAAMSGGGLG